MDCHSFEELLDRQNFEAKSSPATSAGTCIEIQQLISIEDRPINSEKENDQPLPINIPTLRKTVSSQQNQILKLMKYQQIEKEIMMYFQEKGVKVGHSEDFKKQYNKKLHKKVSMMVEVNQVVTQKANAGSSLLERRLQKKMTINL